MNKIVVILGQTATGKSDLAVKIARKINALFGLANPKKKFTIVNFQKLANEKIKEILKRGKTPIICGGTGFYIDAVTKGVIFPQVPPHIKLRKNLDKKSTSELFKILKKLDSAP